MSSEAASALREIAFLLERDNAATYRVRAFRRAAAIVEGLSDLDERVRRGTLTELDGIGRATATVIRQAHGGDEPEYLSALRAQSPLPDGGPLRAALRGDYHTHSDWSDGGSSILEMATAARAVGHAWIALTDHSPRLTVAHGLSAERLRRQLDVVAEVNEQVAPLRIRTGIEVDIHPDGSLDQDPDLLAELDVVVASVHSQLRMESVAMTRRMLTAVSSGLVSVLGHCTGRLVGSRNRPQSSFDAREVFTACHEHQVAVEINSRPDRLDPPRELLRLARDVGCEFAIDSDAHAPGQLTWLAYGCARAQECGIPAERIRNTRE